MAEDTQTQQATATSVAVIPDVVSKLGMAYYGLPKARQEAVDAATKEHGISRNQATFNEICNARIDMYARAGEAEQNKVLESALQVLVNQGISESEARGRLGLGD
jgi:hypothetical protein